MPDRRSNPARARRATARGPRLAHAPLHPTIRDLLSYRLQVVANLLSRGAEMRFRREFDVSLWEWRSVALLGGAQAPMSLNDLAHAAGIDKSQMGRVISGLHARGIVRRENDARDARGVRLRLTAAGRRLCAGLIKAAAERNDAFIGRLSARERDALQSALAKIGDEAKRLMQRERELAAKGALR